MNDDFYLLKRHDLSRRYCLHPGATHRHEYFRNCMATTRTLLATVGAPMHDYELHVPVIFETERLRALFASLDTLEVAFRTLYQNLVAQDEGWQPEPMMDVKAKTVPPASDWCFSTYTDVYRYPQLMAWIASRFPEPSPWEK